MMRSLYDQYESEVGGLPEESPYESVSPLQSATTAPVASSAPVVTSPLQSVATTTPDNAAALTGLYQDVFNRAPDPGGYEFWLNAMNQMGYTPDMVRAEFLKSPEYLSKQTSVSAPTQVSPLQQAVGLSDQAITRDADYFDNEPLPVTSGSRFGAAPVSEPVASEPVAPAAPKDEWERYLDYGYDYETGEETYKPDTSTYIPSDFNWQEYLAKNPDLGAAGIDTEAEALRHYRVHGRGEGRQGAGTYVGTPQEAMSLALKNPGMTRFGQFTVSPISAASMYGGSTDIPSHLLDYTPTSYEVSGLKGKTDKGVKYEAVLNYDTSGKMTGYQIDYQTGGDSGVVVTHDAAGNPVGSFSYDRSESWRPVGALALSVIGAMVGAPQLGTLLSGGALAAGSTGAALLGGAALGAGSAAISGAEGSDILKGAALGAAGSGAGALAGEAAGSLNTALGTTGTATGQAITGALQAGAQALPQAIATGDFSNLLQQAALGGISSAAGNALSSALSESGFTPNQVRGAITLATQLASGDPDPTAIANAAASMVDHPNATVAARAVGVQQALERFRDNPAAITGLISSVQGLAKAVDDLGVKRLPPATVSPLQSVAGGDLQATGLSDVSGLTNIPSVELPTVSGTTTTTTEGKGGVHPEISRVVREYATSIGKDVADFTDDDISFIADKMAPWVSRDPVLLKGASLQDVLTGNYTSIPSQSGGSYVDSNGVLHVRIAGVGGSGEEATVSLADTIADRVVGGLTGLEGTTGDIVRQGISTLLSASGEQIADLSTAFANMGLVRRDNIGVKVGEYLDSIGRRTELPTVKAARENFVKAIDQEPTYFGKLLAGINAIRENPLVLVEAGKEVLQEALPVGVAARVTKMAGIAAGAATSTVMNALESAGSTGRSVYNDEIAKGTSPAEAAKRADRAAGYAAIITTATSGIMDASIAKRYGDAIESYLGRTTSSAGKEFGQESAEEFLIAVASGDSIADAITKSVVGGFVGAKASGSIDATTGLQQSLAEQGLTSSDGTFRPETIVEIQRPATPGAGAGTTATGGTDTTTGTGAATTGAGTVDLGTGAGAATTGAGTVDLGTGAGAATTGAGTAATGAGAATTSTDPNTGATTTTSTDPGTGVTTATTSNPNTNTSTTASTDPSTGASVSTETNSNTGASTTTSTDPAAGTSTTTQTDPNTGTSTTTQVDSNSGTTTQTTVDANTGTATQTTTDSTTNTTTQTSTDTNSGTTTQTTTDNNTGATTETTTNSGTGVTTETTTDSTSGVTTTTETDSNSGVTTQTVVDSATNTTTTTQTDTNTGVTTQTSTNTDTGVTTETKVDTDSGVTTSTTTDPNANTTTTVVVDTNTNVTTSSTTNTDQNITINTTVNYGTGEVEVQVKDPGTGQIILTNVGTIPDFDIPSLVPLPTVTPLTPVKPVAPVQVPPTPQIEVGGNTIIAAEPSYPAKKSGIEETWLGGRFRQTDPLAGFRHLLPTGTPMMQEAQALSALRAASGLGNPAQPDAGYFSYGTEPSYQDVLAPFMNGGSVQGHAAGGKILASPLMAASGGDVPHKGSHYVEGEGGGQDDLIPAKLADGEYVFDAEIVAALGDGSNRRGAELLDQFREHIRKHKRQGSLKSIPPKAKSPLQYLKEVTK